MSVYSSIRDFTSDTRDVVVSAYATAANDANANVTVHNISFLWQSGTRFEEEQELFIKVKTYTFQPLTINASLFINIIQFRIPLDIL